MTDAPMTKDALADAIAGLASQLYTASGYPLEQVRARHEALLAEYERRFGTSTRNTTSTTAAPSGIPWCVDRCDKDGRLIPGR